MKMKIIAILGFMGLVLASAINWDSDLIFSHKFHTEEADANCNDCHAKAAESQNAADDLLPDMETCYNCHDEEDTDCTSCHKNGEEPVLLPRINNCITHFSHKAHIDRDTECETCHSGISAKEFVTEGMHLPTMETCMNCHDVPQTTEGCYLCHDKNESIIPANHMENWKRSHGSYAETGSENCNSCHQKSYCIDCHQGDNLMNQSHPAEFILTHSASYLTRESSCFTCHQNTNYCIECHTTINYIVPMNHSAPDWASQHAVEARIDYDRCTVCHTSGDDACIQCHN